MTGANLSNRNASQITPWFTLGEIKATSKTLEGLQALPTIDLYNSKSAYNNTIFFTAYTKAAINENAIYDTSIASSNESSSTATGDSSLVDSIKLTIWQGNTAETKTNRVAVVKVVKELDELTFNIAEVTDTTNSKDYIKFNSWVNGQPTTQPLTVKVTETTDNELTLVIAPSTEEETDAAVDYLNFAIWLNDVKTVDSTIVKAINDNGIYTLNIGNGFDFELYRLMEIQMHDNDGNLKCYPRWVKDRSFTIEDGKITKLENMMASFYKLVSLVSDSNHIVNIAYYNEPRAVSTNKVLVEYGKDRDRITGKYYVTPDPENTVLPTK